MVGAHAPEVYPECLCGPASQAEAVVVAFCCKLLPVFFFMKDLV